MIEANDPKLTSWLPVPPHSDFPIQNIPFGICDTGSGHNEPCTRIGDRVINLAALAELGYLDGLSIDKSSYFNNTLNPILKYGKKGTRELRNRISELFRTGNETLALNEEHKAKVLFNSPDVTMVMPVHVGDYTDFYSSEDHARNVGTMFRDPNNALLPNWKHIPVGYHGRASSIIISGEDFHRPKGQQKPNDDEPPVFGPCKLMDFELEMAFITYDGKPLGQSIDTTEADDYIFGMVIFNDWSARDIQKWEYVPLGPFLAKNFASSISPWIVTLDALEPFRVAGPKQDPPVLPYLEYSGNKHIDINLDVFIEPEGANAHRVCRSNYRHMYWNMNQQLAHHTVNGCNVRAGDMIASGTISGPTPDSYGSMLELSWRGTKPITLPDGSERKFIADNDTVIMSGWSEKDGIRIGFGEVRAKVLPAI